MLQTILFLHILTGIIALGTAGIAVGSAKGGHLHRRSGSVYALSMLIVGLTALILAGVDRNAFLLAVAVFSLYLVFTGWRAARVRDGRPRRLDHIGGGVMALSGVGMLIWGAQGVLNDSGAQPMILLAFGAIGLTMALADWREWRRGPIAGKARIARHLGRMLGGTIATITAAAVVNVNFLPDLVVWLGPTVVIAPVIVWWTARVLRGAGHGARHGTGRT